MPFGAFRFSTASAFFGPRLPMVRGGGERKQKRFGLVRTLLNDRVRTVRGWRGDL